jgi:hypothetical protein
MVKSTLSKSASWLLVLWGCCWAAVSTSTTPTPPPTATATPTANGNTATNGHARFLQRQLRPEFEVSIAYESPQGEYHLTHPFDWVNRRSLFFTAFCFL